MAKQKGGNKARRPESENAAQRIRTARNKLNQKIKREKNREFWKSEAGQKLRNARNKASDRMTVEAVDNPS